MITIDLQSAINGLRGFFYGAFIALALSGFILAICTRLFIFRKADEPGWKALIPFYSEYLCYDIVWDGQIYILLMCGTLLSLLVGCLVALFDPVAGFVTACVPGVLLTAMQMIAYVMLQFRYARAFGRSDGFAIGLLLLNPVFMAILAFGECRYLGIPVPPQPVRPPVDHYSIPPRKAPGVPDADQPWA